MANSETNLFSSPDFKKSVTFMLLKKPPPIEDMRDADTGKQITAVPEPPFTTIPSISKVNEVNPDTKALESRTIQLVPGELSIYVDEQSEYVRRDLKKTKKTPIHVHGYLFRVPKTDVLKLEYLKKCAYNADNPDRPPEITPIFKEYKPAEMAKKGTQQEVLMAEAIFRASQMPVESKKAYLMSIEDNVPPNIIDELDPELLTNKMIFYAKNNPAKFLEAHESPDQKVKYYLKKAVSLGVLKHDIVSGILTWANGDMIIQAPAGQSPYDTVIRDSKEFNDKGERAKSLIEAVRDEVVRLSSGYTAYSDPEEFKQQQKQTYSTPKMKEPVKEEQPPRRDPVVDTSQKLPPIPAEENPIKQFIKDLKSKGIIRQKQVNIFYKYNSEEEQKTTYLQFRDKLEKDPDFRAYFNKLLS